MKRKYLLLMVSLLMVCACFIPASGAEGRVRVKLPSEMEGQEIFYSKTGEEQSVKVQEGGLAVIENLSPGEYEIQVPSAMGYEFQESKVPVPCWDEETQRMSYDITVEPKYHKYQKVMAAPDTGDDSSAVFYGVGCILALTGGTLCIFAWRKKRLVL